MVNGGEKMAVDNYSLSQDIGKSVKQSIGNGLPAVIAVLALLQTCSGLDAIVVAGGVTVGALVTFAYRFIKNHTWAE